jgi:hypothetical protein
MIIVLFFALHVVYTLVGTSIASFWRKHIIFIIIIEDATLDTPLVDRKRSTFQEVMQKIRSARYWLTAFADE